MSLSGYKDSMYWASEAEIAEWRARQQKPQQQAVAAQTDKKATPAYRSFTYRDENGHPVSAAIQKTEPVVIDGFLI